MNIGGSTVIRADRPHRRVIQQLRRADAARNARHKGPSDTPATLPPAFYKQRPARRRGSEKKIAPPFGGVPAPSLPTQPAVAAAPEPEPAPDAPMEEAFIEFGPGDEYDYPIPEAAVRPVKVTTSEEAALYKHWNDLLPLLAEPLLRYKLGAYGQHMGTNIGALIDRGAPIEGCAGESCAVGARNHQVTYVHMQSCIINNIKLCSHVSLPVFLISQGMLPSSPVFPGYAYSIDMLDFFLDLSRNGANSAQSLAATLHAQHRRNGFVLRNAQGEPIFDGFRQQIGPVVTWYDILRSRLEKETHARIAASRVAVLYPTAPPRAPAPESAPATATAPAPAPAPAPASVGSPGRRVPFPTVEDAMDEDDDLPEMLDCDSDSEMEDEDAPPSPSAEQSQPSPPVAEPWHPEPPRASFADARAGPPNFAIDPSAPARHWLKIVKKLGLNPAGMHTVAQYLVSRCPKCFAAEKFGINLDEGGDIQVASDGNFGQRHDVRGGDGPPIIFLAESFVSKEFVDAVGDSLAEARAGTRRRYDSSVPDAAINQCEKSHTAANGSRVKAAGEKHDDRGLMALVCRHDIPIYICNIDTPGEQQKYSVALLLWLLLHLPPNATVMNLYDVGCVLHKSLQSYQIMPESMESRILFATSAMHAYAHQWECQLVYSPRMRPGLALTDGEGVERLWSRLCKLIGILRGVHRNRRIIILDRHVDWLAMRMRDELGRWLTRKWKLLKQRETGARKQLLQCGYGTAYLREQWADQRDTQLRVRRMTAPRLKKELEAVMAIQDQVHAVEEAISAAETALREADNPPSAQSRAHLDELRKTLGDLTAQADALYSSLNVEEDFPGIREYGLEFAHALIMAYDAKCIARHKLIGRFFEWDYLDRAVGGKGEALGTRQHQKVVQSIQRRAPAIANAILRYNTCCANVRALLPPGMTFPLPEPLPTDLTALKNDPALLDDVWVNTAPEETSAWLTDSTVRTAIRAQLILDRCAEERIRLKREQRNLFNWLELEGRSLAHALRDPANALYVPLLKREVARLEDLATGCKLLSIPRAQWLNAARGIGPPHAHAAAFGAAAEEQAVPSNSADRSWPAPFTSLQQHMDAAATATVHPMDNLESDNEDESTPDGADQVEESDQSGPTPSDHFDDGAGPVTEFHDYKQIPSKQKDTNLAEMVAALVPVKAPLRPPPRFRDAQDGFQRISIGTMELHDLAHGRMLGPDVLYGALAALAAELTPEPRNVAVFHPRDYSSWALTPGAQPSRLYSLIEASSFWSKQAILVPIWERPHWSLAIVYPSHAKIDFFDSFGFRRTWKKHAPLVAHLISAMLVVAASRGHDDAWPAPGTWVSRPQVDLFEPKQTPEDKIDCGVWLLAVAAAVFLSFRTTSMTSAQMPALRQFLYSTICKHIPAA